MDLLDLENLSGNLTDGRNCHLDPCQPKCLKSTAYRLARKTLLENFVAGKLLEKRPQSFSEDMPIKDKNTEV